jgi:hypothetical protein
MAGVAGANTAEMSLKSRLRDLVKDQAGKCKLRSGAQLERVGRSNRQVISSN